MLASIHLVRNSSSVIKARVQPPINQELQMIEGLKSSNRRSQEAFYKQYFGKMFPIALRYSSNREDAEEIISTAFLKVINTISKYNHQNFGGWVSTIVKRTAIDYCRKYKYGNAEKLEIFDTDAKVYNEAMSNLGVEEIIKIMQQLPPASRTVFNLFAIEGYTHKEIGQKLNISAGTSKWHVAQSRTILLNLIKAF